jgi:putative intracellular protease/amidase
MAGDAPLVINDVGGAAAVVFNHTTRVKQVKVKNQHATQTLTVRPFTGNTSAAAAALAAATPAVIGADDNWTIAAGKEATVFKSSKKQFVSLSVIASGAGTTFCSEGTIWRE